VFAGALASLTACAETTTTAKATGADEVATTACEGSAATDVCGNGTLLCAEDHDHACMMCRCMEYPPLEPELPDNILMLRERGLIAPVVVAAPPAFQPH
jgi:hypothetical protein